jgi:hypothetical protein
LLAAAEHIADSLDDIVWAAGYEEEGDLFAGFMPFAVAHPGLRTKAAEAAEFCYQFCQALGLGGGRDGLGRQSGAWDIAELGDAECTRDGTKVQCLERPWCEFAIDFESFTVGPESRRRLLDVRGTSGALHAARLRLRLAALMHDRLGHGSVLEGRVDGLAGVLPRVGEVLGASCCEGAVYLLESTSDDLEDHAFGVACFVLVHLPALGVAVGAGGGDSIMFC